MCKFVQNISKLAILASLFLFIASCLIIALDKTTIVGAINGGWMKPGVTAVITKDRNIETEKYQNHQQRAYRQKIFVGNNLTSVDAEVYYAKSFRLAYVQSCLPLWWGGCSSDNYMALSVKGDFRFYRVEGMNGFFGSTAWQVSPEQDRVVYNFRGELIIIDNLLKSIDPIQLAPPDGHRYQLTIGETDRVKDESGSVVSVNAASFSANGNYVVGEATEKGLFLVDLESHKLKMFTRAMTPYWIGMNPSYEFDVSRDGKYVLTSGTNVSAVIYEIDDNCGIEKDSAIFWGYESLGNKQDFPECTGKSLNTVLQDPGLDYDNVSVRGHSKIRFGNSDQTIEVLENLYHLVDGHYSSRWLELRLPSYVEADQLDYLALGDSYSSGEGDIDRKSDGSAYYLASQEFGDKCHLSNRSYPFRLRDHYGVASDKMASVACSGAVVSEDYYSSMVSYMGQNLGLKPLEESAANEYRIKSIEQFIPGIVPQIEFIKMYQPKIITLTGGGNDVRFARILEYCAGLYFDELTPGVDGDCGYAKEDSSLHKLLYNSIDTQYYFNKRLIEAIKQESPNSRIITIGYPSFINSTAPVCSLVLNAGLLSLSERQAINQAINYMNKMFAGLAYDTGTSFVDIEQSLEGGRLCEGSELMTGVFDSGGILDIDKRIQSFHPNAKGHSEIANKIIETNVMLHDNIPNSSDYIIPSSHETSFSKKIIDISWFIIGSGIRLIFEPGTFLPESTVEIIAHSDEISLGEYQSNADGSLDILVDTSNVPIGSHILVASGQTYSGEPLTYYQFVDAVTQEQVDKSKGGNGSPSKDEENGSQSPGQDGEAAEPPEDNDGHEPIENHRNVGIVQVIRKAITTAKVFLKSTLKSIIAPILLIFRF